MARKFELKQVELLPPLEKEQVENLIKFCRLNAYELAEMSNYEGCCWSDDFGSAQGFVYDSLNLGYGLVTPEEYFEDEDDEEEDEDE